MPPAPHPDRRATPAPIRDELSRRVWEPARGNGWSSDGGSGRWIRELERTVDPLVPAGLTGGQADRRNRELLTKAIEARAWTPATTLRAERVVHVNAGGTVRSDGTASLIKHRLAPVHGWLIYAESPSTGSWGTKGLLNPIGDYRLAVQAYVQWHRTWRRTGLRRHLETTLTCLAIARERHAIARAAVAGEKVNQEFKRRRARKRLKARARGAQDSVEVDPVAIQRNSDISQVNEPTAA